MVDNFPFKMPAKHEVCLFVSLLFLLVNSYGATTESSHGCYKPECILLNPSRNSQMKITVNASQTGRKKLRTFCYTGQDRLWSRLWVNPRMSIEGSGSSLPDDLSIYYGQNVSDVQRQSEGVVFLGLSSWLLLNGEHSFFPFNLSCIGLSSHNSYTVHFRIKNPELWYIAYIVIGVIIFLFSPSWSRNIALHYTTGMTVGVLASVLIVMFILTRLMPQRLKTVGYIVMAVSSSASLFMFQVVKNYLQEIVQDHWQIALGYVLVSGLLSFGIIYRFGPITDTRTLNLVCWVMQGFGLVLIYQGTQIPETSAAIILLVLTIYLCPKTMPQWMVSLRFRLFPPRHRFLTEEEYFEQADVETRKALEDLREYCNSPECNAWRVVSRLSSPTRFAKFIDGEAHVSDAELDEHDAFIHRYPRYPPNLSNNRDDDDDDDDDGAEEDDNRAFPFPRHTWNHAPRPSQTTAR